MNRHSRATIVAVFAAASVVLLSACSVGPPRDANGHVTETTVIGSTTMEVGVCFSFEADLSEVSVTPCSLTHTYIVIGKGELDAAKVATADSVQNAASAACSEAFAAFKAAAPEGVRPTQEFIIATEDRDGETVTLYTCVATDES
ncbi:MAG: hypothetical protein Q8M65_11625 [Rhodoglobus sp.]|nr:hypothetical protein [Rhodoglobus sp.]